jgi:hypothetical protein
VRKRAIKGWQDGGSGQDGLGDGDEERRGYRRSFLFFNLPPKALEPLMTAAILAIDG